MSEEKKNLKPDLEAIEDGDLDKVAGGFFENNSSDDNYAQQLINQMTNGYDPSANQDASSVDSVSDFGLNVKR